MEKSSQPMVLDVGKLRDEISKTYAQVAATPDGEYHFHTGIPLTEKLGYPSEMVQKLPAQCVESFAGVGNPFSVGEIEAGEVVLDIGSGCGFDTFIASAKVGEGGKVFGIDMTDQMLEKAGENARLSGCNNIEFRKGYAEEIPVEDGIADVIISNGVINLCPDKSKVFAEAYRLLKPGGRLMIADIIVHEKVSDEAKCEIDLWTG